MKNVFSHGLPFRPILKDNILALKKRIKDNKASLLIIDGGVGQGKTTLGVHVGDAYQGSDINLKYQYAMGGEQFQEKLQICENKKHPVLIYDEAGDFSKRGALTNFNKRLNRVFETFRVFKILIIVILPNFSVLDEHLFNLKIPRILLNVTNRKRYGHFRAYSLYRMHYIKHKMNNKKVVIKETAYSMVTPNFHGEFKDLSPERSKELEKISKEGKKDIISENILESKGLYSIPQLVKKVGRSHIWVRAKLKEMKIKHVQIYKKKKYYEGDCIEQLLDFIKK